MKKTLISVKQIWTGGGGGGGGGERREGIIIAQAATRSFHMHFYVYSQRFAHVMPANE